MFLSDARHLANTFPHQEKLIVIIIRFVDALSAQLRLAPRRATLKNTFPPPRKYQTCSSIVYRCWAVVGSIVLLISVILVAGNPLSSACRRITASSLARYTQNVLSAVTKDSFHWISGAS